MIQPDIDSEDLESMLAICNHFQLAAIELSDHQEIVQANSIAELLFFRTQKQLLNKSFNEISKEFGFTLPIADDLDATPCVARSVAHRVSDKQIIDVAWTTSHILKEGECVGFLLVGKIIAEHFVNRLPMMLDDHFMNTHFIGVFSKDLDGNYLMFNDHLARTLGLKQQELAGQNDYLMPWASEADILRQGDNLAITENSTIVLDEYGTFADGSRRFFYVTKSPLLDDHGKPVGVIGTSIMQHQTKQNLFNPELSTTFGSVNVEVSNVYLTKKEIECVRWMIRGKSAAEIGGIVHASPRTIEAHLNNVKIKLNCFKQFQLGYLFGKYGHLLM